MIKNFFSAFFVFLSAISIFVSKNEGAECNNLIQKLHDGFALSRGIHDGYWPGDPDLWLNKSYKFLFKLRSEKKILGHVLAIKPGPTSERSDSQMVTIFYVATGAGEESQMEEIPHDQILEIFSTED